MTQTTGSRQSIDRLIANRQYSEALPLLKEICRDQPRNVEKRQQLAEVLAAVGERRKAFRVLESLVDEFAHSGQYAKAIAVVKRMQIIEPGRHDLDMKLAVLVKNQQGGGTADPGSAPKPQPAAPHSDGPDPGEAGAIPVSAMPKIDDLIKQVSIEERLLRRNDDPEHSRNLLRGSKLLQGFGADELQALIGRLQLTEVAPGEIIVAEGEPGSSLFMIASGSVRVYVRNRAGAQKQVRVMKQGDFFGEISLLKSIPRTATITAATEVELLELNRRAVNAIAERHPGVWRTIEDFCTRRKGSAEEVGARSRE